MPMRWSQHPSSVTLSAKVRSPMALTLLTLEPKSIEGASALVVRGEQKRRPGEQQQVARQNQRARDGVQGFQAGVGDRIDDLRESEDAEEHRQAGAARGGQREQDAGREDPDQVLRARHLADADED